MPITANALFRDSVNFIRNQFSRFIMLAFLASVISYVLLQALVPDTTALHQMITDAVGSNQISRAELQNAINNMSQEQQLSLVEEAMPLFGSIGISFLLSNVMLIGGVITLVIQVSKGQTTSVLHALGTSAAFLPMLLILMLISSLVILFGLSFYLLPGLFFAFALALSPVILLEAKQGIIYAITTSWRMAFAHMKIVLSILLFTLSIKFILLMLSVNLAPAAPMVISLLMETISNLITAFLFVYLFRLYMQIK
ncbi:MAG: hypothetical protein LBN41_03435 [Enterobacteriaceae bacterium]|jgi:hypothetical protein|nr:hypothetical protein [Enterobacteriaceae bacterium]